MFSIFIIHYVAGLLGLLCVCWVVGWHKKKMPGCFPGFVLQPRVGPGRVDRYCRFSILLMPFCRPLFCRLTIGYLNHSWGVGPNTFKRWERQQADATAKAVKAALEPPAEEPFSGNVIVNSKPSVSP